MPGLATSAGELDILTDGLMFTQRVRSALCDRNDDNLAICQLEESVQVVITDKYGTKVSTMGRVSQRWQLIDFHTRSQMLIDGLD